MSDKNIEDGQSLPAAVIECLRGARRVAVLTGAGVSAESGIPTFREAQTGLWAQYDPMMLASPQGFERNPERVWNWYEWRRELVGRTEPNAGHRALAELEPRYAEFTLITQNVDGLHRRAGSRNVLELHGNIARNICSATRKPIDDDWIKRHGDDKPPPSPHDRRGRARPDVVWFGEALDAAVLDRAFAAASNCEVMLVVGTSGEVQPAASLPFLARDHGARVIDVNPERTSISAIADWHLAGPGGRWLPSIVNHL